MPPWYHCDYPFSSTMTYYGGAIYEDTVLKKVYLILPGSTTDTLLYDFSLGVGDTIPFGINNQINPILYVDQIDSVQIGNSYRKRLRLGNTVGVDLIEGIGSTSGLLENLFIFECGGYLDCVSWNGQTIYPDTSYPCDLMNGINEFLGHSIHTDLKIYPNPLSENLTIISNQSSISSIEIYDPLAKIILSSPVNCASCTVNCDFLPPGIYFVKATAGEKVFFGKVIKQ